MPIEGFNYTEFAQSLSSQAVELVPADFKEYQKNYISKTIFNFANLAGEALVNDKETKFNIDIAMFIVQIIAEWTFHKSVDLIKGGIPPENWDGVMQKIAFTIFEVAKQTFEQNIPQDQIIQLVEQHVKQAYKEAIDELNKKGLIDEALKEKAESQSNIDAMMEEIQRDKEAAETQANANTNTQIQEPTQHQTSGSTTDNKILKLASIALLLKQLPQEKVQAILAKFTKEDVNMILQYMQMPDLDKKVDKNIAMQYLNEMMSTLPEPKVINPDKIISRLQSIFTKVDREKVELMIRRERPNVKRFIFGAYEGDYYPIPTKVANVIAQYVEDSV